MLWLSGRCAVVCLQRAADPVNFPEKAGDVVQLVRTLPCHGRGREFESRRPRHSLEWPGFSSVTDFGQHRFHAWRNGLHIQIVRGLSCVINQASGLLRLLQPCAAGIFLRKSRLQHMPLDELDENGSRANTCSIYREDLWKCQKQEISSLKDRKATRRAEMLRLLFLLDIPSPPCQGCVSLGLATVPAEVCQQK